MKDRQGERAVAVLDLHCAKQREHLCRRHLADNIHAIATKSTAEAGNS